MRTHEWPSPHSQGCELDGGGGPEGRVSIGSSGKGPLTAPAGLSGTGNPIQTKAQAPPPGPSWQPWARWPQVTPALGTWAVGAAPPLGQPDAKATSAGAASLSAARSALPPWSTAEPPQASTAKSKSGCSLPRLLRTCRSACPQAARPVTFHRRPVPAGGAPFRVQHSPPGSAQKDSGDTSPPRTLAPRPGQPSRGSVSAACQARRLSARRPPRCHPRRQA